jgi:hypothetical protein
MLKSTAAVFSQMGRQFAVSDRAALTKLCDPGNYVGEAGAMVDRVLAMRN